ncbi:Daple [Actinoplanes sp. ATCC 53533]|uniref:Daple n=1 Tax=Actinoplanes sp. ATCC 53533 TaxID=1288362 RepID=UPI001F3A2496|nr:Daple [Actinoplanes sp. ATCC 53533]
MVQRGRRSRPGQRRARLASARHRGSSFHAGTAPSGGPSFGGDPALRDAAAPAVLRAGAPRRAGSPGSRTPPPPGWSDSRARYQDLLAHLSPNGSEPRQNEPPRAAEPPRTAPARPDPLSPELLRPEAQETTELRAVNGSLPASAPPYPYEGDLDDARREPPRPPIGQQRAAVPAERPFPAVRPATPGGRRADWTTAESARHALNSATPMAGLPDLNPLVATDESRSGDQGLARPSYDPSSFPRRLPYEPADTPAGYAQPLAFPTGDPGPGEPSFAALPQRVPAEPDVPTVPEPPSVEPPAETPALARIATHLRRGDVLSAQERQEGFDVNAILAAVREVDGVRDASLRSTPAGAHSLRLDLSEGADPAEVSRQVARLLQDRMGLDAAMKGATPLGGGAQSLAPAPRSAPPAPTPLSPAPRSAPPSYSAPAPVSAAPAAPVSPPPVAPASAPPAPAAPFVPSQPNPAGRPTGGSSSPAPAPGSYSPGPRPVPGAGGTLPASRSVPGSGGLSASRSALGSGGLSSGSRSGPASAGLSSSRPGTASGGLSSASRPVPGEAPTSVEPAPPRPLDIGERPGPRVMIENVRVNTFGTEATVEVQLTVNGEVASGDATGPAVDGYLLRLCALATAGAVDELLTTSDHADGPAKCFVEHAAAVQFGSMQVAVVVMLLSVGGWVEQLSGSAVITGDDRHAMVRATLNAVNRRLEALLS